MTHDELYSQLYETVVLTAPPGPILDMASKAHQVLSRHEKVMVAVSGGSDSDTMLDLIAQLDPMHKATYVYYEGVSGTLRANMGDNQMAVAVGFDAYNQAVTGDVSKPLTSSATDSDHTPVVIHPDGNYIDVEMEVAVRKYEVDCTALCTCLREHKVQALISNKDIAERLDLPLTMVEHWFRQDTYFAVPEPEVWPRLKELLDIKTDEFDQSIMTFEFKGGNYDMRNRIHMGETSPTLTGGSGKTLHLVPKCPIYSVENHPADSRVSVDDSGKVQTLTSRMGTGGGNVPMVMEPQLSGNLVRGTHYIVRRLMTTECARLQGFADWWGTVEQKDSLTDEEYQFWLEVRNTHAAINGKKVQDYTEKQMLTWYNKLYTDSAEYKMWGNGIALPPALYCLQGIVGALIAEEDAWMY